MAATPTQLELRPTCFAVKAWGCFDEATIELPEHGLAFITGPNNTGKTLLGTAIAHGQLDRLGEGASVKIGWSPANRDVTSQSAPPGEFVCLDKSVTKFWTAGDGSAGVVAIDRLTPDGVVTESLQHGAARGGRSVQSPNATSRTVTPFVSTDLVAQASTETKRPPNGFLLSSKRIGVGLSSIVSPSHALAPDGANLPNVLLHLRTNREDAWPQIEAALSAVLGAGHRLSIRTDQSNLRATVANRHGSEFDLDDLGSGVSQALIVAVAAVLQADQPAIFVLDEPERGLHPTSQRALVDQLRRWAETRLIVVITHSPDVLNRSLPGEPVYLVEQDDKGRSSVDRIESDFFRTLLSLGSAPVDSARARKVLVVEGPSDKDALEVLYPELALNPWALTVPAHGGSKVTAAAEALRESLQEADPEVPVFELHDRDESSKSSEAERLVLPMREIENAFLECPATVARAIASMTDGAVTPSTNDVKTHIGSAIDELMDETIYLATRADLAGSELRQAANLRLSEVDREPSLDSMLAAIANLKASIPTIEQAQVAWNEKKESIELRWPHEAERLVRGSQVLDLVFKALADRRYKKPKHLGLLARSLDEEDRAESTMMSEVDHLVAEFLGG